MIRIYPIDCMGAPRQVQKDKWRPSPQVQRYRAFKDELRIKGLQIPEPFHHMVFVQAMPASWGKSQRLAHEGMPHRQKPDRDNLEKAVLDTYFGEDAHIWNGATTKIWGKVGVLLVSDRWIRFTGERVDLSRLYRACDGWRTNGPTYTEGELLGLGAWDVANGTEG